MNTISHRAKKILNLKQYSDINLPEQVEQINADVPNNPQYVLRMLINRPNDPFDSILERVPQHLQWTNELIQKSLEYQIDTIQVRHSFIYLTVRSGPITSVTDDEWHVDGFSTRITHIPEQNYVWVEGDETEYCTLSYDFPLDFDPLKYNVNYFFQDKIKLESESKIVSKIQSKTLTVMDPYIVHRRPKTQHPRTFVRVSHVPIQIQDRNNTLNPLLPKECQSSKIDGVEFRNGLLQYPVS